MATRYQEFRDGMADCFCEMEEDANGEFVSYEDYQTLETELAEVKAENERLRELVQHIKSAANLSDSHGLPLLEDLDVAICSAMQVVESPRLPLLMERI